MLKNWGSKQTRLERIETNIFKCFIESGCCWYPFMVGKISSLDTLPKEWSKPYSLTLYGLHHCKVDISSHLK